MSRLSYYLAIVAFIVGPTMLLTGWQQDIDLMDAYDAWHAASPSTYWIGRVVAILPLFYYWRKLRRG